MCYKSNAKKHCNNLFKVLQLPQFLRSFQDYEPTTSATPGVSVSVHVDGEDLELDGLEAQSSKRW